MLSEKVDNDFKEALKARDEIRISTLRLLRASIHNTQIAKKKKELSDEDIIALVQQAVKKGKESVEAFGKGNRPDLVTKEEKELEVLAVYLPEQLGEEELVKIVKAAIAESGAASKADLGRVMKLVIPQVKGRADGKLVNQIVARELEKPNEKSS